jgi:hypothetical protein
MANETSPQARGRAEPPPPTRSSDQPRPHYPPPKPPPPPSTYVQRGSHQPGYGPAGYPQQGFVPSGVRAAPPAYWPLTIISFLCSFLFGGIAMYFSAQVGSRWRAGDVAGAQKASKTALIWGIIGLAVGLLVFFALMGGESSY